MLDDSNRYLQERASDNLMYMLYRYVDEDQSCKEILDVCRTEQEAINTQLQYDRKNPVFYQYGMYADYLKAKFDYISAISEHTSTDTIVYYEVTSDDNIIATFKDYKEAYKFKDMWDSYDDKTPKSKVIKQSIPIISTANVIIGYFTAITVAKDKSIAEHLKWLKERILLDTKNMYTYKAYISKNIKYDTTKIDTATFTTIEIWSSSISGVISKLDTAIELYATLDKE